MNFIKNSLYTRWFLWGFSCIILTLILWNTYQLFQTFKSEERAKMQIWAQAYETINNADPVTTDIEFPSSIVIQNTTIPIVLANARDSVIQIANVDESKFETYEEKKALLSKLKSENKSIKIAHPDEDQFLYYGNSNLITKLKYYPLALIAILALFIGLIWSYFRTSKVSAENKLWAGMAKETAHQIGTPLSSLLGWVEIMRMDQVDETTVSEIEKDVYRLQTIADRFSKIGSETDVELLNIVEETKKSFEYLKARSSKQIDFEFITNADIVQVWLNPILHSWTIENLIKNAIDAIRGKGRVIVELRYQEPFIYIMIKDTGKGMEKSQFTKIFEPGYSTKKRGWGLGLSLTKRIVEIYHKGRIKVVQSEVGKGTTFMISYKKSL